MQNRGDGLQDPLQGFRPHVGGFRVSISAFPFKVEVRNWCKVEEDCLGAYSACFADSALLMADIGDLDLCETSCCGVSEFRTQGVRSCSTHDSAPPPKRCLACCIV